MRTGQLADNSQSFKSWTGQLVDSELILNHGKTTLYLYTKPKRNPVEYQQ